MVHRIAGEALALDLAAQAVADASDEQISSVYRPPLSANSPDTAALDECGGLAACLDSAAVDCWDPWEEVLLRPNASRLLAPVAPTIMNAFTINNPTKCLFQDDVDALNVLYPVCGSAQAYPICSQPTSYLGYTKLGVYIGLPVLVMLLAMCLCHRCSMASHERARREGELLLYDAVNDADFPMHHSDGSTMSDEERRALLFLCHLEALTRERRAHLDSGKRLSSVEVRALDEQRNQSSSKLAQLRDGTDTGIGDQALVASFVAARQRSRRPSTTWRIASALLRWKPHASRTQPAVVHPQLDRQPEQKYATESDCADSEATT